MQVFGFVFVTSTEKCIANDICDGGREGGAHFFTFPPVGSANERVGKVCLPDFPTQFQMCKPSRCR
jgi:hypothetical protein